MNKAKDELNSNSSLKIEQAENFSKKAWQQPSITLINNESVEGKTATSLIETTANVFGPS